MDVVTKKNKQGKLGRLKYGRSKVQSTIFSIDCDEGNGGVVTVFVRYVSQSDSGLGICPVLYSTFQYRRHARLRLVKLQRKKQLDDT